jgi:hypothetical protein
LLLLLEHLVILHLLVAYHLLGVEHVVIGGIVDRRGRSRGSSAARDA